MVDKILFDNVKILDCTLRDGGHLNKWDFSKDLASRIYSASAECGIYCCEVGYVTKAGIFPKDTGMWRYSKEDDIRSIVTPGYHTKVAVMADIGKIELENFRDKEDSVIDLVRLAFYPGQLKEAVDFAEQIVDKGYEVSLNLMAITSYSKDELEDAIRLLYDSRVDHIVFADSFGSLFPNDVENLVKIFKKGTGKSIGYHGHNNLELAFANALRAVEAGADMIDCSIYGMGRGAGNLPLEVVLSYIKHHEDRYSNLIPLFELIEQEFISLRQKLKWGYSIHYLLSGMLKCHPNYALAFVDEYELSLKDTWSKLIKLSNKNEPKFDKKILSEIFSSQDTSGVPIRKVDYSTLSSAPVKLVPPTYKNIYANRDFIILAQGPSLKQNISKIKGFIKKHNLVVLGANYLHGLIVPDYHIFSNIGRFVEYAGFADEKSKLLLGAYISENLARRYVSSRTFEVLQYLDEPNLKFDIKDGIIQSNCGTVSVLMIGLAIVMGARKIYVAGLDGYKTIEGVNTHFYPESKSTPRGRELLSLHNVCEKYLEEIEKYQLERKMEPFSIITPTSYSKFYKKPDDF